MAAGVVADRPCGDRGSGRVLDLELMSVAVSIGAHYRIDDVCQHRASSRCSLLTAIMSVRQPQEDTERYIFEESRPMGG